MCFLVRKGVELAAQGKSEIYVGVSHHSSVYWCSLRDTVQLICLMNEDCILINCFRMAAIYVVVAEFV